jgi:hypothetical protein
MDAGRSSYHDMVYISCTFMRRLSGIVILILPSANMLLASCPTYRVVSLHVLWEAGLDVARYSRLYSSQFFERYSERVYRQPTEETEGRIGWENHDLKICYHVRHCGTVSFLSLSTFQHVYRQQPSMRHVSYQSISSPNRKKT